MACESCEKSKNHEHTLFEKFLDTEIQDVSTSISIVHDLIEKLPDDDEDGDESDKHIKARDRRYSCLTTSKLSKQLKTRLPFS